MYFLYRHIRLDKNEPFYIGIGTARSNATNHVGYYGRAYSQANRNRYWRNIVSVTPYDVEILFETDDRKRIEDKEIEMISLYGRKDKGEGSLCNLNSGGVCGLDKSRDAINRQIATAKKNGTYDEMVRRISEYGKKSIRIGIDSHVRRDVYVYDLSGKYAGHYYTMTSFAIEYKSHSSYVSRRIDSFKPIKGVYVFSKYMGDLIDNSGFISYDFSKIARHAVVKKSITVLDKETLEIIEFKAIVDAAIYYGIKKESLYSKLKRGSLEFKRFKVIVK